MQAKTRGLCKKCYTSASNAILRGKVHSWGQLEEMGLSLPTTKVGPTSAFGQALADKLKQQ